MKFRIYRYDPEQDARPRTQDYDVELAPTDRMLLDALVQTLHPSTQLASINSPRAIRKNTGLDQSW